MFQGLQENQLEGAVEAMLFVTDEPVGTITLAEMLECEVGAVEAALVRLREDLETRGAGIQLREVAGGWRLFTHPAYHELIEKYVLSWDTRRLSAAAMETLAIVAYTQPVTRAGVASVRGVNSDSPLNSLVEKGLVREVGTADAPGNPVLYGTTRGFLEKFGLRSPADLPDLADFAPDEETRRLITERLSATREDAAVSDEQARTMARSLMGEDYAEGDGEAMLFDEEMAEGADAAAASLDAATEELGDASGRTADTDAMFARAIASTLGVVDKIDFDSLVFETDDE
ncbi:SMC-Scp complex subunit ScpB [Adlercreutzia sp. R25]|uniref:SMC-Scp complex subunit ScpB n=1 Tax=Adlercreutzia shanghongiae TaxID=3111773 RepID=A0ABU6IXQ3_9ACTN|nr:MULTISPECIES: SMC-Scp complex subunit ScpB [unclassified Adlercreutzia]MEC4272501.1 SMC-Scp complex subunit ScpB [Adlercreutzia sp. R25]MEC4294599.1 SMC-Scp complex subunit ScpB [Adlercreutzia sp. R22]